MKHQWINLGGLHVHRMCLQCGKQIPVSRDVDPVAALAVEDCPVREQPVLYCIEPCHLVDLRAVAKRLYTEDRMNGDEMRNAAHVILAIVRFAESLDALCGPGEPYVHLYPREKS